MTFCQPCLLPCFQCSFAYIQNSTLIENWQDAVIPSLSSGILYFMVARLNVKILDCVWLLSIYMLFRLFSLWLNLCWSFHKKKDLVCAVKVTVIALYKPVNLLPYVQMPSQSTMLAAILVDLLQYPYKRSRLVYHLLV